MHSPGVGYRLRRRERWLSAEAATDLTALLFDVRSSRDAVVATRLLVVFPRAIVITSPHMGSWERCALREGAGARGRYSGPRSSIS